MSVVKSGNHVSTPLPLASWSGEVWELRQRTQISTHSQHLNWNNSISAKETEQFGFITCFLSYDPAEDNGSGCISWSFELGPLIESGEMGSNLPRSTQLKSINDVVFVTITLKANAPQIIINIYYICLITWKILCLLWRQSWKLNKYIFFYLRAPYNRQLVELLARVWFVPVRPWSVSLAYNYTQCQALLQWHWRCWCGGDCVLICWHCWHKHRRLCHHLTGWTAPCKTSGPGTLYKDTLNKDVESSWEYLSAVEQWPGVDDS